MSLIQLDKSLCSRLGHCIESCPNSLLRFADDGYPEPLPGAEDVCVRCGHCVAICHSGALSNELVPTESFPGRVDQDDPAAADPVGHLMRVRRSVRSYRPQAVPKADLKAIFDVVRYAPTSNNAQNLWWIATTDRVQTGLLAGLACDWMRRTYYSGSAAQPWPEDADPVLRGAPHLALCCGPAASRFAGTDAVIALTHLDLLAQSRGLGTCWAGVFMLALEADEALRQSVAIPEGQKAFGALLLGYPARGFRLVPPRKPSAVDWR